MSHVRAMRVRLASGQWVPCVSISEADPGRAYGRRPPAHFPQHWRLLGALLISDTTGGLWRLPVLPASTTAVVFRVDDMWFRDTQLAPYDTRAAAEQGLAPTIIDRNAEAERLIRQYGSAMPDDVLGRLIAMAGLSPKVRSKLTRLVAARARLAARARAKLTGDALRAFDGLPPLAPPPKSR